MSRSVTVLDPGLLSTVQDEGRSGLAHLGVPRSGWLDGPAARLANRLVGNPEGAAVVETVLGGLRLRADVAVTVAVTGTDCSLVVSGQRRPRVVPAGTPVTLRAGDELSLRDVSWGLRSYVALAGGLEVAPVLGSRSTDTLSGTGPAPLAGGDVLGLGEPGNPPSPVAAVPQVRLEGVVLRCLPGPRLDWFDAAAWDTLTSGSYRVGAHSDRIGLRLEGPRLQRSRTDELPSEGIVLGAVQVPADGQPLVFLNDHPTTGGYPVVAVVDPADLHLCAQLRPGDEVGLSPRPPVRSRRPPGVRR